MNLQTKTLRRNKTSLQKIRSLKEAGRHGAMLPMVGFVMIILFVACAFAVDIARMHLTRSELRTATDAAARAAVENVSRTNDLQQARDAAVAIAQQNMVAGRGTDT